MWPIVGQTGAERARERSQRALVGQFHDFEHDRGWRNETSVATVTLRRVNEPKQSNSGSKLRLTCRRGLTWANCREGTKLDITVSNWNASPSVYLPAFSLKFQHTDKQTNEQTEEPGSVCRRPTWDQSKMLEREINGIMERLFIKFIFVNVSTSQLAPLHVICGLIVNFLAV